MSKGDPSREDSTELNMSMSDNLQSDFLTLPVVIFSTPYEAGSINSFHISESLSNWTKCHQCWVREQVCLSPESIFFLLQRWLKHDSGSGGRAKRRNTSLCTSVPFELALLLFFFETSALEVESWQSGLLFKCSQTTGGSFVKKGREEK